MFGFMSSLNGVIVQRLLRRLCPSCADRCAADQAQRDWLRRHLSGAASAFDFDLMPRASACDQCRGTGYRGRMVVAEVHVIDDPLRDLVTGGAAMSLLREQVKRSDATSLSGQGAQLVAIGATTIEEVRRVVGWL
jgi:general secretion pathway protein E